MTSFDPTILGQTVILISGYEGLPQGTVGATVGGDLEGEGAPGMIQIGVYKTQRFHWVPLEILGPTIECPQCQGTGVTYG